MFITKYQSIIYYEYLNCMELIDIIKPQILDYIKICGKENELLSQSTRSWELWGHRIYIYIYITSNSSFS